MAGAAVEDIAEAGMAAENIMVIITDRGVDLCDLHAGSDEMKRPQHMSLLTEGDYL
jgi:hypothetical protein